MRASRFDRWLLACVLVAPMAAATATGCSSKNGTVKVTGVAKLTNGRPLPGGRVFLTGGPAGANGAIKEDGSFVLGTFTTSDGAKPGKYTVTIVGAAEADTRSYDERMLGAGKEPPSLIARKYDTAATSDLKVEIGNRSTVLDLSLEPSEAGAMYSPAAE